MIDRQTQLYGIIGCPVSHSLSPIIHNGVFKRMGVNAAYLAFEVKNLRDAVMGIRGLNIRGASVTLPFKTEIIPLLDAVNELAKKIGAVNTIGNEGGRLIGFNTDWFGALEALEEKVDLMRRRVLLLGAGGAARAIAFALKESGSEVIICNRSADKGLRLAQDLECTYRSWSSIKELEFDLLVNATSVGMYPHDKVSPVPSEVLSRGMTVMDIVYSPLKTKLLREAEEKGCQTIDGLEMLARQGAAQFEIWTGIKPAVGKIKKDLRRALRNDGR
jgi:shikimate dehydrogenase